MKMKIGQPTEKMNTDSVNRPRRSSLDVTFTSSRRFVSVDLFSVTVHELGHSLGLMHSNIPDAIMFPYYRGYSKDIKLHTDDIAAIRKLYGGRTRLEQRPDTDFAFADPPPDVSAPSVADSADTANVDGTNSTEEASTRTAIPTSTSSSTLETSTTTLSPLTPSISVNEAQIQDEQTTKATTSSRATAMTTTTTTTTTTRTSSQPISYSYRSKTRYTSRSPSLKSTSHWLHSYHETRSSTAKTNVSYADRSKLDLCEGFYDAITMYKGILFIFKGQVRRSRSSITARHCPLSLSVNEVFLAIRSTWSRSLLADDQQCLLVRST